MNGRTPRYYRVFVIAALTIAVLIKHIANALTSEFFSRIRARIARVPKFDIGTDHSANHRPNRHAERTGCVIPEG
jgi:hypothetical protein